MTILFSDRADYWGFKPDNFLINYCNANGLDSSQHFVDESTTEGGLRYFHIHPQPDGASS